MIVPLIKHFTQHLSWLKVPEEAYVDSNGKLYLFDVSPSAYDSLSRQFGEKIRMRYFGNTLVVTLYKDELEEFRSLYTTTKIQDVPFVRIIREMIATEKGMALGDWKIQITQEDTTQEDLSKIMLF